MRHWLPLLGALALVGCGEDPDRDVKACTAWAHETVGSAQLLRVLATSRTDRVLDWAAYRQSVPGAAKGERRDVDQGRHGRRTVTLRYSYAGDAPASIACTFATLDGRVAPADRLTRIVETQVQNRAVARLDPYAPTGGSCCEL